MIPGKRTLAAFIYLVALLPAVAMAGTIHGVVQSEGSPIVGATIRLLELDRETH